MVLRLTRKGRRAAGLMIATLVIGVITALVIAASAPPRQAGGPTAAVSPAADPAKYVYLTFDDGPDPKYTPQILDILATYGAKATFFEVGEEVARHPELSRRVHLLGHSVQNHTWSHPDLRTVSWASFKDQIQTTDRYIQAQTGYTPRCLRPPYGSVNSLVSKRSASLGKDVVRWKIDSRDWARPGTAAVVRQVLDGARNGSVILMHDGGGDRSQTVAALPAILKTLKAKGYVFYPIWCR
ncbi:peptidoglycan/xylan/chitin deacetylase (PgdA/CDA1 family) [Kribbella sp. VKM Ac-2527]|uniref:Peptidoglycan/xylan/chitin deacetylase (PgdA/CDA1 family) n=1 Tax=Kribbella caucasensis TaxID=2512215 RepID=A0A4V3CAT6_9ACTN|nr:polysaccharide deacetylase family protein [Kribbella sp. VKM Ac-2527]TDO52332.1 peptidoglycan/xylan/chitin deacetylase (PgdA/CDA1 family) [Kribbella sp. VKM Ac-2527]